VQPVRTVRRPRSLPALRAGRVRHRLTPTGRGLPPPVAPICPTGDASPHPVGARRCLARPRRMARRFNAADTSRPTRSADQPSSPLHDRPAVNGRAQSPSRLKPADPYGARTQPIDPSRCAPHSPLQGACGLSPGLKPRAFDPDRPGSDGRGTTAPFGVDLPALPGRRVRQRLTPTNGGQRPTVAPTCPTGDASPHPVGARRCLARPRRMARQCNVADASRPTRSADQPSGPLHDRPAVNGRGFSPGRSLPTAPAVVITAPRHPSACVAGPGGPDGSGTA
jgi:hypothetical protein